MQKTAVPPTAFRSLRVLLQSSLWAPVMVRGSTQSGCAVVVDPTSYPIEPTPSAYIPMCNPACSVRALSMDRTASYLREQSAASSLRRYGSYHIHTLPKAILPFSTPAVLRSPPHLIISTFGDRRIPRLMLIHDSNALFHSARDRSLFNFRAVPSTNPS